MSNITKVLVGGIGVNDVETAVAKRVDGRLIVCPYYRRWTDIIHRCTNPIKYHQYIDCTIHPDWLLFSNFRKWMMRQEWEGRYLDKDIIIKGNKVYSESACAFVLSSTNNLVLDSKSVRGDYLLGVSFCKRTRKYQSCVSIKGRNTALGRFTTEVEAHNAWRLVKSKQLYDAANNEVDTRVQEALRARASELEVLLEE